MPIHNVVYGGSLAREIAGRAPHSARATAHKKGWVHEVPHSSLSGYSPRVLAGVYTVSPQPPPDAAAHHMWAGVGSPLPPATPRRTDEELARHSQRRPATAKARRKVPLRQLRWLRFGAGLSPEAPMAYPAAPEAQAAPTCSTRSTHSTRSTRSTRSMRSDSAALFNQQAVHAQQPVRVAARKAAGRRADAKAAGRLESRRPGALVGRDRDRVEIAGDACGAATSAATPACQLGAPLATPRARCRVARAARAARAAGMGGCGSRSGRGRGSRGGGASSCGAAQPGVRAARCSRGGHGGPPQQNHGGTCRTAAAAGRGGVVGRSGRGSWGTRGGGGGGG